MSYITCHDNYCLRDRIEVSAANETELTKIRMNKLAQTAVLVSQGMTFIYGGEELYRTKLGIDNSYQSPDSINIIPWENKQKYNDLYEYYRQMIQIRRRHKGFRLGSTQSVNQHFDFLPTHSASSEESASKAESESFVAFRIKDLQGIDSAKSLVVLLNGGAEPIEANIPMGEYMVLAADGKANVNGLATFSEMQITVAPYSATILAEK